MDEIELKFLDINVEEIKEKLKKIGAKLIYDSDLDSISFLAEGFSETDSSKKELRVRKTNQYTTITYKDPAKEDSDMTWCEETEIKTNSFEDSIKLLEKLGFKQGKLCKKHREHYELENIAFEFDTYSHIPTYLEIETQSEQDMIDICKKLDLDINSGKKGSIMEILPEKFN